MSRILGTTKIMTMLFALNFQHIHISNSKNFVDVDSRICYSKIRSLLKKSYANSIQERL